MSQIPPQYSQDGPMQPDRGGLILTLGILSLVLCGLLGPFAWVMGSNDLKAIDAGRMDPRGRGTTQAGMVCGIISTVLLLLPVFAIALFVLIGVIGGVLAGV